MKSFIYSVLFVSISGICRQIRIGWVAHPIKHAPTDIDNDVTKWYMRMDISGHVLNSLLALSVLITLSSVCVNIANLTSHDNLWSPGSQYWHSASAFSRRPCDTGLRYLTLSHVFYFIWRNSTLSLVYKLHTLRGAGKLFAIITTRNMASAAVRELLLSYRFSVGRPCWLI